MIASFIIVVFAKFVRYLKWVADQYTIGLNQIWLHVRKERSTNIGFLLSVFWQNVETYCLNMATCKLLLS